MMKRRTFVKYSIATSAITIFPQLVSANKFYDAVTVAYYASKLNPVRLIAGLIFDRIAEVYVEPLTKQAFNDFLAGKSITKSSLNYYDKSSVTKFKEIEHERYKASVVVYGVADYELYKQKQLNLQLKGKYDKKRFAQINQYLKEEKVKLKLYNRDTTFRVGNDLEPNDLFNIQHIIYGKTSDKQVHIEELLKRTDNSAFSKLIA